MKIKLGFSPCPNDTFMFDALVHEKIDTEGLIFDVILADIEQLNKWSIEGILDATKISYSAFLFCHQKYIILDSGSALGNNCGPILVKKKDTIFNKKSVIAIPGEFTTANMLFSFAFPDNNVKKEVLFSQIEDFVLTDKVDAGLLIHENRFTYQNKGLVKIKDLGEYWEETTRLPIPLGSIVVKRKFPDSEKQKIQRVIRRSIQYAFNNPLSSREYVKRHAQEITDSIIEKHIKLYVNEFSISLKNKAKRAVLKMFEGKGIDMDNMFYK